MKMRIPFLSLLMICSVALCAQDEKKEDDPNLIVNGNFENTAGKLKKLGQLSAATGWTTANEEKADLFSKRAELPGIGAPNNEMGISNPKDGDNFAGILTHNVVSKDGREYITSKLKKQLKKGQKYCISYSISLADVAKYATNNLGFHFSKKALYEDKNIILRDAVYPRLNKPQTNMEGWTDLCMTFTGKGDENYITIGNFASGSTTVTEKVRKPLSVPQEQKAIGYYYLDNVSLVPVSRDSECTCKEESANEGPKIIFSSTAGFKDNATAESKITSSTVYFYENEDVLAGATKRSLDAIAEWMTGKTSISLDIKGHMDENEVEKGKQFDVFKDLSKTRAEEVKQYLIDKGVDSSRLSTSSVKADEPATTMKTPLSMAKNRRVEFIIR